MNNGPHRPSGLSLERPRSGGDLKGHAQPQDRRAQRVKRLILGACFLATCIAYVERTGFSVAYTAAAKEHNVSEAVKGTVMSSFFWGYAVSQVLIADAPNLCRLQMPWCSVASTDQHRLCRRSAAAPLQPAG